MPGQVTVTPLERSGIPKLVTVGPPPKMDSDQEKALELATAMTRAHAFMLKTPPADLPGPVQAWLANPQSDPTFVNNWLATNATTPEVREYMQEANAFAAPELYRISGAAFGGAEYPRILRTLIPMLGDSPRSRKEKLQMQADFINHMINYAYTGNPAGVQQARADAAKIGTSLGEGMFAPDVYGDDLQRPPSFDATSWSGLNRQDKLEVISILNKTPSATK